MTETELAPRAELNETYLTKLVRLCNGTSSKKIEKGEAMVLTAFEIYEHGGDKYIKTEIGTIKLNSYFSSLNANKL